MALTRIYCPRCGQGDTGAHYECPVSTAMGPHGPYEGEALLDTTTGRPYQLPCPKPNCGRRNAHQYLYCRRSACRHVWDMTSD